ncbi:AP2-like factor [Vigna unguiculata]|uniref:AP2-like factor n=1 Tax=Vigna unguiculata TaxID=3917 RepID=A0A4D6MAN8_VIGUN|nr:AP2-like factor [Vigna unguiculata]
MVALKLGGSGVKTNFPETQYKSALEAMTDMSKTEVVDSVRMLSFTFTRAISIYRGVSRDFSTGKWQADLDEGNDNRIFLGLFESEEEAARAYDIESIKLKGLKAITNFSIRFYNVDAILLGETDPEKVMYQPQFTVPLEAMQAFDEVLYNITGQGNVNREGVQEFQMSTVSGKTEEHANSTNVPLQRETDSTHVVNGSEEGSTPREKFEAYMKFIKRQT